VGVLLGLLKQRGAGTATIARQLGAAYYADGDLAKASEQFAVAKESNPSPALLATCTHVTTSGRGGKLPGWRCLPGGLVVGGKYRIEREVGRGGMASVYRAVGVDEVNVGEVFALKVPAPALMANDETRKRFVQEIRTGARLHHPDIVRTLGYETF